MKTKMPIFVAFSKKIFLNFFWHSGALLPAIFAAELRKRLRRGQCNDDALIVLSVNDSAVRTMAGWIEWHKEMGGEGHGTHYFTMGKSNQKYKKNENEFIFVKWHE